MFTATIFVMALAQQGPALACPISGEDVGKSKIAYEFAGSKFTLCCPMCVEKFKTDPAKAIKESAEAHRVVAEFQFDPVSGAHIDLERAKLFSDYNGIRFPFGIPENKKLFDASPKKYSVIPPKESRSCAVGHHPVESYATAGGFVDFKGVRYYMCCDDCLPKMIKEPGTFAPSVATHVKNPEVSKVK